MTVLDAKLLAQHRAGRVLALDAGAIGASIVVHATRPSARSAVSPVTSATPTSTTAAAPTAVAVVDIIGPLAQRGESQLCGFVDGYDWIGERLGAALEEADAVVLRIDSPGGDVAGITEGVRRMRAAVVASGKHVIAYVDELAASAAYWLAAGVADEIVVPPMGRVGSIGVFAMMCDLTKANAQDGIGITIVRDPAGKAPAHPDAPIADLAHQRLSADVRSAADAFIHAIAAARGLSTSVLRALDGAVLTGEDAVRAGLADRVGTLEDTIRAAATPRQDQKLMATKQQTPKAEDPKPEPAAPKEPAAAVPIEDGKVTCPECGAMFEVTMPAPAPSEGEAEQARALAALVSATKATSPLAALAVIASERSELAQLRAEMDRRLRADIGAELVRAGALPADVWADPASASDPERRAVSALYAAMPLEDLRAQVGKQSKPAAFARHTPATSGSAAGLTEREQEFCARKGIDPLKYAATKAASERRSRTET